MILVLCADLNEIEGAILELVPQRKGSVDDVVYVEGWIGGKQVVLGSSGIGVKRAREAAQVLIRKFTPELVVAAGFGSALSPILRIGEIVLGEYVISRRKKTRKLLHRVDVPIQAEFISGGILTENKFIHSPEEKRILYEETGALCVDMESWGIVEAAEDVGVPVLSVKAISDEASHSLPPLGDISSTRGAMTKETVSFFLFDPWAKYSYARLRAVNLPKTSKSLSKFLKTLLLNLSRS
ncbi:MAG: hypothetical protein QXX77_07405 [Candidatus Methanosuratincola sp.]|jgi:adenosylhomocysteine nucleosidase